LVLCQKTKSVFAGAGSLQKTNGTDFDNFFIVTFANELIENRDAIVQRWYEAWRKSRHPHPEIEETLLKDMLSEQLKLIGFQIKANKSENTEDLWLIAKRLDPEERVIQKIPIEEVVQEYRIAVETVRCWIEEKEIEVSFKEYSYFYSAIFQLVAESVRRYSKFQHERISRDRSDYLARLTHQMRNPLSAISLNVGILSRMEIDQNASRAISILDRNIRKLNLLINGVMRMERYKPEEIPVRPESLRPMVLLEEVMDEFEFDAAKKKLRLEISGNRSLRMEVDSNLLVDAFGNLIQNAIKYTEKGFVRVLVEEQNSNILFKVIDSGPGISKERQKDLFKPTKPGKPGGVGIGLSIAARAVAAQSGEIGVTSELGKGSTFWFYLPKKVKVRSEPQRKEEDYAA